MNKNLKKIKRKIYRKVFDRVWNINQRLRRSRLASTPKGKLGEIIRQLTIPDVQFKDAKPLITVSFGSRQLGNRDNLLENFCKSFLKMTQNPSLIEIILKIDDDDDLIFFSDIKKKFGNKINIRFVVSPRGRGYADMHIWHADAFKRRSPSSLALFILTEDVEFCFKNWDTKLIAMIKARPDNFFIATPCPLEEAIRLIGPNPVKPVPVYWLVGAEFPVIGMDLLKCTQKVAEKHPGCTCYGDLFLIDSFSGDLLKGLWEKYEVNLDMEIPEFAVRKGVFSWTDSKERSDVRNNTLLEFFKEKSQKIRDEMVDLIYREYNRLYQQEPAGTRSAK